jgi:hypothetical protein
MLTFGTGSLPARADKGGRMCSRVPWLRLLEPFPHLSGGSCFELIRKVRAFFGIIGISVGIYAYLSSAMAAVEEDNDREISQSDHSRSVLSQELTTNLSVGNMTDGGANIPETVWSLDVSSGAHLDRFSVEPGSEINTVLGVPLERTYFWFRTTPGFWGANGDERARHLLAAPLVFQVASCGGSSAEHPDLDRCDNTYNNIDPSVDDSKGKRHLSNDDVTIGSSDVSAAAPNDTNSTTSELSNPPTPSPYSSNLETIPNNVPDSSLLALAATWTPSIDDLNELADGPTTPIDGLTASIDDPTVPVYNVTDPVYILTPPIDDPTSPVYNVTAPIYILTPPIDFSPPEVVPPSPIISVGDPEPGSGQRPIPEAPTWVMTTIGFSVVIFIFRKKKRNRVIPISIIDAP